MIIGVDTDGVLTDIATFTYEKGKQKFGVEPKYPDKYTGPEMFDFKMSHHPFFGLSVLIDYAIKLPPREHAKEVVDKLTALGDELYCITSRLYVVRKNIVGWFSRRFLLKWYKKHELKFKDVVLCEDKRAAEEKLKACRRLGVEIMIDDKPEIANLLAENGIEVLLFDAPYNQKVIGEKIHRVFSWDDIEKYFDSIR